MTFGERLKALRRQKDFTQDEMAAIFNTNRPTYSNWENDRNTPAFTTLIKIAKYFNVTIDYLLGTTAEDALPKDSAQLILTPEVFNMLSRFQILSPESKSLVFDFINHLVELERNQVNKTQRGDHDERL